MNNLSSRLLDKFLGFTTVRFLDKVKDLGER
jgi:hypothetical protein